MCIVEMLKRWNSVGCNCTPKLQHLMHLLTDVGLNSRLTQRYDQNHSTGFCLIDFINAVLFPSSVRICPLSKVPFPSFVVTTCVPPTLLPSMMGTTVRISCAKVLVFSSGDGMLQRRVAVVSLRQSERLCPSVSFSFNRLYGSMRPVRFVTEVSVSYPIWFRNRFIGSLWR